MAKRNEIPDAESESIGLGIRRSIFVRTMPADDLKSLAVLQIWQDFDWQLLTGLLATVSKDPTGNTYPFPVPFRIAIEAGS